MKNLLFLFASFSIIVLAACSKEKQHSSNSTPVSVLVDLMIENKQGQSLLDPNTPGYFKNGVVKKYDLINGQSKLYYEGHLDWYNGYNIVSNKGNQSYITIVPNTERTEASPLTSYIDWGNGDTDTLVCSMKKNQDGYYYLTEEVWFNGDKVYPFDAQHPGFGQRGFKIVK